MKILPGFLKELSKHIPTVLFETVEWSELASEIPKISRRIIQKDGRDELVAHYQPIIVSHGIEVKDKSDSGLKFNRAMGEKILTLYFMQIFDPRGAFIDFRDTHFGTKDTSLVWIPNNFWTKWDTTFQEGLKKVYDGFYLEKEDLYYEGLTEIGLLRAEFGPDEKKILGDIFRKQFGNSLHEDTKFELEHLNQTIVKMSEFMLQRKVKISKDFLYLGIYLVTLYSTLEKINEKLPVKEIYLKSRDNFLTSVKS